MGGMQQPPQFNWRCVTLNKWCKNKPWLEAWGRGPGDAACFIGQELCTAPGWNGAMHCWDTLQPPGLPKTTVEEKTKASISLLQGRKEKKLVLRRRCGWVWWPDCFSSKREHIIVLIQFLNAGKQIHNWKVLSKHCLPHLLLDLIYVNLCFEEKAANSLQLIPFPCVIHK